MAYGMLVKARSLADSAIANRCGVKEGYERGDDGGQEVEVHAVCYAKYCARRNGGLAVVLKGS